MAYNQSTLQTVGYNDSGLSSIASQLMFSSQRLLASERSRELEYNERYYKCTQHDHKGYDFDGRVMQQGNPKLYFGQSMIGDQVPWYVPLMQRRPSAPYRIGRSIVNAFSAIVFGEHRFPSVNVAGDDESQDWLSSFIEYTELAHKMSEARTIGGSCGTVGLSWCFVDGEPKVSVHHGKNLHVHQWKDRHELIPSVVSELYVFEKEELDQQKQVYVKVSYWYHRLWTEEADVVFYEVPYHQGIEPEWIEDPERSFTHNDGCCHLIWIQNTPNQENVDGDPDYEGLYEQMDQIDVLNSIVAKGGIANLDPTLVMKVDPDLIARKGIQKGSGNALIVGVNGDAHYMELGGQSINAGLELLKELRREILETAQCVLPNENEIAAQGISSVAIHALYSVMTRRAGILRAQYGKGIRQLLCQVKNAAQQLFNEDPMIFEEEDGSQIEMRSEIKLPHKIITVDVLDPITQEPTGEVETKAVERRIGYADDSAIQLVWPQYFLPTPDDKAKVTSTLQAATGGQALISQDSAVVEFARLYGLDPRVELEKIKRAAQSKVANQSSMFGDMGGVVDTIEQPDTTEEHATTEEHKEIEQASTTPDASQDNPIFAYHLDYGIFTVNEIRATRGLPPLPDGDTRPIPAAKLEASQDEARYGK